MSNELLEQLLQEGKQTNLLLTDLNTTMTELAKVLATNPSAQVSTSSLVSTPPMELAPMELTPDYVPIELPTVTITPFKLLPKTPANSRTSKIGINDAPYRVSYREHGKTYTCPYYEKWKGILRSHFTQPSGELDTGGGAMSTKPYKGNKPQPEWLYFSNFREWYVRYEIVNEITPPPIVEVTSEKVVTVDDIMGTATTSATTKIVKSTYTYFSENYNVLSVPEAYIDLAGTSCEPPDSKLFFDASMQVMSDYTTLTVPQLTILLEYDLEAIIREGALDYFKEHLPELFTSDV